MEYNRVYHGDWMTNTLPDKSVNLLIADPPYFEVKGDFDFVWESFDHYLQDVERWAVECKRILADNGTLFWWGMDRKIAYAQVIFDKYFSLLGTPVWEKPSIPNEWETRRTFPERGQERLLMYSNDYEPNGFDITGWEVVKDSPDCFASIKGYLRQQASLSGKPFKFFQEITTTYASHYFAQTSQWAFPTEKDYKIFQKETGFFKREYEDLRQEYEDLRQEYEDLRQEYEDLRQEYEDQRRPFNNYLKLTDILRFPNDAPNGHPTKKPEKLTRALILTCSRPGDLVLVPFAGSGTECAMAAKEGRRFIGFDVEHKYVEMSNTRAARHMAQKTLFA